MGRVSLKRLSSALELLLAVAAAAPAQQPAPELQQAGACARCHVTSVLEWGLSRHQKAGTDCVACHGPSHGHVIDERNNVKPDRISRGAAMAALCETCHASGCPNTKQTASCETCHHHHALLDPNKGRSVQDQWVKEANGKLEAFNRYMADGDRLVKEGSYPSARDAFQHALEQVPDDRRAAAKLRMTERRIDPRLAGFDILGGEFDPESGLPRQVKVTGTDIDMVLIPAGDFDMGSDLWKASTPVSTVSVEAFYLAKSEVTQGQWKALMGANPSLFAGRPDSDRLPVEQVSWNDCQIFIGKLNARVPGGGFRLPTEAEWEYAARAGSADPLSHDQLLHAGWFRENSVSGSNANKEYVPLEAYAPQPVGTSQPNRWGLYDMLGNVWEWTSSLSRPYPYDAADGRESATASGLRVLRGGSFVDSAEYLDPALRHAERSDSRYRWNGFRLARGVPALVSQATTKK
jgi:formylglycine-generating enzyme required for sulfatase activity